MWGAAPRPPGLLARCGVSAGYQPERGHHPAPPVLVQPEHQLAQQVLEEEEIGVTPGRRGGVLSVCRDNGYILKVQDCSKCPGLFQGQACSNPPLAPA